MLAAIDPVAAARLHPNDLIRVSRALEVFELSGKTLTEFHEGHGFRTKRMESAFVGLAVTPEALSERIATRIDHWLANGWIEEVEALVAAGYGEARAMGSVGYAEIRAFMRGELARSALRDKIVQSTRIFARHQRTWLKSEAVDWLDG